MDFDFSISGIFSGFIFGVIGLYVFRHGRKVMDTRFIGIGVALMVYPYFTNGPWADWGVGMALCALAYYFKDH